MDKKEKKNNSYLELATFVMSCARTSIDEPNRYGFIRLMDIYRWLADLPQQVEGLSNEPILNEIRSELDAANDQRLLENDEQRIEFADSMIRKLVSHLKETSDN